MTKRKIKGYLEEESKEHWAHIRLCKICKDEHNYIIDTLKSIQEIHHLNQRSEE